MGSHPQHAQPAALLPMAGNPALLHCPHCLAHPGRVTQPMTQPGTGKGPGDFLSWETGPGTQDLRGHQKPEHTDEFVWSQCRI